jgi:ankyrin repeat protein
MFGWLYNGTSLISSPWNYMRLWWNGWNDEGAHELWKKAVEGKDMPLARFLAGRFPIVGGDGKQSLSSQMIEQGELDTEKLDFLLGVDVKVINEQYDITVDGGEYKGVTLLISAIIQGKNELAGHLLGKDNIDVDICDNEGRSALQYTVSAQGQLVEEILKKGPDLRNGNAEYVFHKFPSAANLMIKQCADQMHVIYIASIDTEQDLAIDLTVELLREAFLHAIEQKGENWLLQREVFLNQVMQGNNFNFKDQAGQTLLTRTLQKGYWQLAELMQTKGANLDGLHIGLCKDLLKVCIEGNNLPFFEQILAKYGNKLQVNDVKDLFLLTAENGSIEIYQKLLGSEVANLLDVGKIVNENGDTALHIAVQHEQTDMVKKLLLDHKWNLGQQDGGHSYAFHIFKMLGDVFDGEVLAKYQDQAHILFAEALHTGNTHKLKEISAQDLVCKEGALGYAIAANYPEAAVEIAAAIISSNAGSGQWPSIHGAPIIRWEQTSGDELTTALKLIAHKLHGTYDSDWAGVVAQLLEAQVSVNNFTNVMKQALFNNMVLAGKFEIAAELQSQNSHVDVNAKVDGIPLIFHALELEGYDAFDYLLGKKVDLNVRANGQTLMQRVAQGDDVNIVLKLLQENVNIRSAEKALIDFCKRSEISSADAVKVMNRVADKLHQSKDSALLYIVQKEEYDLAKKVLEVLNSEETITGINAHDYASRKTVLHILLEKGNSECTQKLLQHNVELNAVDYRAKTPLMCAAKKGLGVEEIIEKAFNTGKVLSVNAKDADGKTALMYAAERGESRPLEAILKYELAGVPQTDIDAKDNKGNTAIAYAAQGGKVMAVKCILAKMHDLDVKSEASVLDFCGKNWYSHSLWGAPYVNDDVKSVLKTLAARNSLDPLTYVLQKGNFGVLNKVVGSCRISDIFASKDAGGKGFMQYLVEDKSAQSLKLVEKIANKCGTQKLEVLYNLALDADNEQVLSRLGSYYKAGDGHCVVVVEEPVPSQEQWASVAPSAPEENDLYAPKPSAPLAPEEDALRVMEPSAPLAPEEDALRVMEPSAPSAPEDKSAAFVFDPMKNYQPEVEPGQRSGVDGVKQVINPGPEGAPMYASAAGEPDHCVEQQEGEGEIPPAEQPFELHPQEGEHIG